MRIVFEPRRMMRSSGLTCSSKSPRGGGPLRRVWFSLRSNVPHPTSAGASFGVEARAKLLALLADELLFEPGLLDVTVTGAGVSSCWIPPGSVDEDGYRRRRLAGMRVGEPVVVAWTPEGDEVTSPLVSAHVLEYHTLLRRSGLAEAPGSAGPASRSGPRRRRRPERPAATPPGLPIVSERRTAAEQLGADLARDLERGARLGAAVAVDGDRRPLLAALARVPVPDASRLPWRDVVALRDDPAIAELRAAAGRYAREQTGPRRAAPGDAADRLDEALRRARGLVGRRELPDAVVELAALAPPGAGHNTAPASPDATAVLLLVASPARRT